MSYLFQFVVLIFTAGVWWLARRDLVRRSAEVYGPATQEWGNLQQAVQTLIADLERRATEAEQRVAAAERHLEEIMARDGSTPLTPSMPPPIAADLLAADRPAAVSAEQTAHDDHYAPVYALLGAGVTDAAEIARRTGLGQGEVALLLALHSRQPARQ